MNQSATKDKGITKVITVEEIEDIIPEIYCDVPIDTIKVVAYRKGKKSRATLYNLRQENGKDLAQAIFDRLPQVVRKEEITVEKVEKILYEKMSANLKPLVDEMKSINNKLRKNYLTATEAQAFMPEEKLREVYGKIRIVSREYAEAIVSNFSPHKISKAELERVWPKKKETAGFSKKNKLERLKRIEYNQALDDCFKVVSEYLEEKGVIVK